MEKWLCWFALGVSGLMLLLFILDIATGIPFGGGGQGEQALKGMFTVDIFGILAGGVLVYLSVNALRDLR